uniref:Uncharacterized protein n=1 Tax=Anguilla anguilla TaxID=7936 RepID=A0A0E9WL63_ANGAN
MRNSQLQPLDYAMLLYFNTILTFHGRKAEKSGKASVTQTHFFI